MGPEARGRQAQRAPELVEQGMRALQRAGVENPRLDAELLLAEALGVSRTAIAAGHGVANPATCDRYAAMVARRAGREPLAYILGRKEFYSLELEVTPAVLIPRPETETVVEAALKWLTCRPQARMLDLGTGSGAIAIAIATNAPRVSGVATDLSLEALAVARRNLARYDLSDRIVLRCTDCFQGLDATSGRFDAIVSNPPYIADEAIPALAPEIALHEPRAALAAGSDGLSFYRRIAARARDFLERDGCVFVELGDQQARPVAALFARAGFGPILVSEDLAGMPRVLQAISGSGSF